MTRAYLIGAVLLASALASFAQSPAASPVGLPAIAAFDRLPLVEDDAQFLYASSYDRTGETCASHGVLIMNRSG